MLSDTVSEMMVHRSLSCALHTLFVDLIGVTLKLRVSIQLQ